MKLSIIIPARNEQDSIRTTVDSVIAALKQAQVPYELIIVNDGSTDNTTSILTALVAADGNVSAYDNPAPHGFGYAIRYGLEKYTGDCVAIMMADLSDSPEDLVSFYRTMAEKNVDCVWGTRWSKGGRAHDYPLIKRIINRIANWIIRLMIRIPYNDTTNAFKLYKRCVIDGVQPLLSPHFNLTIELPLKAFIRGYSFVVLPNRWTNRTHGVSKLKIKEMGSRYFFILLYCFIEKYFSRGDFKRSN